MFYSISGTGDSEKKIRVFPTGVEPMTFWLLVQILYHWATGDSREKEKKEKKEAYFLSDVLLSELRAILLG